MNNVAGKILRGTRNGVEYTIAYAVDEETRCRVSYDVWLAVGCVVGQEVVREVERAVGFEVQQEIFKMNKGVS